MYRISPEVEKVKIDVKDKKILALLSENSRLPVTIIARKVGLSRDTTNYRINRLVNLGVIIKFFPDIDFMKLGYSQFRIFMVLDETDEKACKEFLNLLKNHTNTKSLIEYSDRWDIEWSLVAKDIIEFDKIVTEVTEKYPDIILDRIRLLGFNTYYSQLFTNDFYEGVAIPKRKPHPIEHHADNLDYRILDLLGEDCRVSTYEIGAKIGLSPDAVSKRINKLVDSGIIVRFTLLVNYSLLGFTRYTFATQLKILSRKNDAKLRRFIKENYNITKAVRTLGTWDFLIYIIAQSPRDFHFTIKAIKKEFVGLLRNYDMWVAYKEHIYATIPKVIAQ